MFKVMLTLKKKDGMSREDFINHYETVHAPLACKLFGFRSPYRRNYIVYDDPFLDTVGRPNGDFDVITENDYATREEAQAVLDLYNGPQGQPIRDDEVNLFAPGGVTFYLVEGYESPLV